MGVGIGVVLTKESIVVVSYDFCGGSVLQEERRCVHSSGFTDDERGIVVEGREEEHICGGVVTFEHFSIENGANHNHFFRKPQLIDFLLNITFRVACANHV